MKYLSKTKGLIRLKNLKDAFRSFISANYEHRAKSCVTCEAPGACCLDSHFVNVHISSLEAVLIERKLAQFPDSRRTAIYKRIDNSIAKYELSADADSFSRSFACPLFEPGAGCLVHEDGKPLACIAHACYASSSDLPPDELLREQEILVDALNTRVFGDRQHWLPLPLAIKTISDRDASE